MKTHKFLSLLLLSTASLYLQPSLTKAETVSFDEEVDQLLGMSIEQLASLQGIYQSEVKKEEFSSSKKLSRIIDSPSAVYTITREDIKRAGATSVPEALRLAPGVQVARSGTSDWAISVRGFAAQFATKLLVLIDGRAVYTPLFSGVFWDEQDLMMEDIARIEVVRGPGATVWGANAVNGVINIITKNARGTQGTLVDVTTGAGDDRGIIGVRHGGKTSNDAYYRVYAKYNNRASTDQENGDSAQNSFQMGRGGFRVDWRKSEDDRFSLPGDGYYGQKEELFQSTIFVPPFISSVENDIELMGANLVAKWERTISDTSNWTLQTYFDKSWRNFAENEFDKNTFDIDFQHRFKWKSRHELAWGLGYRFTNDNTDGTSELFAEPAARSYKKYSFFLQDKIALLPEKLFLTVGSKFEHNDFSEYEYQPSARLGLYVTKNQFLWAAVSRALRTPKRSETDARANFITPIGTITATGSREVRPEEVIAYEMGYKNSVFNDFYFDVSLFYNDYKHLNDITNLTPLDTVISNGKEAHSYGGEIAANWDVNDKWVLKGSYSLIHLVVTTNPGDAITNIPNISTNTPNSQFTLSSNYQLPHNVEISNVLYRVNSLEIPRIDSYFRFDSRISWEPRKGREINLVAKNIFDDKHKEFQGFRNNPNSEIGRSIFANVKVTF